MPSTPLRRNSRQSGSVRAIAAKQADATGPSSPRSAKKPLSSIIMQSKLVSPASFSDRAGQLSPSRRRRPGLSSPSPATFPPLRATSTNGFTLVRSSQVRSQAHDRKSELSARASSSHQSGSSSAIVTKRLIPTSMSVPRSPRSTLTSLYAGRAPLGLRCMIIDAGHAPAPPASDVTPERPGFW